MTTINGIIIFINCLVLLVGACVFIHYVFVYTRHGIKRQKAKDKWLIAEIRKEKQENIESGHFNADYDKWLDDILFELVGIKHDRKK